MEYKIFKYLRNNKIISIPIILRLFFGVFLILLSVIPIVLPIFPGSLFLWLIILVVWLLSIVPGRKIRLVIKIRKWITYLFQNIHNKQIIKHKIYDIKNHILEIIDEEDEFNK
jgi:hypothetical protein